MVGATPQSMTAAPCLSVPVSEQDTARVPYPPVLVVTKAERQLGVGKRDENLPEQSKAACLGQGSKNDPTFCGFTRAGNWT
jgi:hypothetical protein